jgi:hypothetical protein
LRGPGIARFSDRNNGRERIGGDARFGAVRRESLRGQKAQESKSPCPELNVWGGKEGDGFSDGRKPLERRCEAEVVSQGSARAEGSGETQDRSSGRRKALEGEAQERWELKEASEGWGADTAERVAKP